MAAATLMTGRLSLACSAAEAAQHVERAARRGRRARRSSAWRSAAGASLQDIERLRGIAELVLERAADIGLVAEIGPRALDQHRHHDARSGAPALPFEARHRLRRDLV